jgi:GH24 family phage-related lysozyme (muramidase)
MPTTTMRQDIPFEIQEEVQVSEMSPQESLSGILTMQDGGKVDSNSNEEYFEEVVRPLEFGDAYFNVPKYYNKNTNSYVAYEDSEGKLTFGAGVLVDKDLMKSMGKKSFKVGDEISQSTIDNEALKRWNSSVRQAKELYPNLTNKQVNPIAEMVYQMGKAGVNQFKDMRKAIEAGDADAAKKAALASKWAKQTPKRAKEVAERLRASFRKGGDIGKYFEGQVEGEGDGMSDEITFRVEGGNPDYALLSKDEYVLPADVVSMLGNGSSDAGSDELDQFVKDTRKQAFGREEQQTQIDAEEGLSSLV